MAPVARVMLDGAIPAVLNLTGSSSPRALACALSEGFIVGFVLKRLAYDDRSDATEGAVV